MEEVLKNLMEQTKADFGFLYSKNKQITIGDWDCSDEKKIGLLLRQNIAHTKKIYICKNTAPDKLFRKLKKISSFVCFPITGSGAILLGSKNVAHFQESANYWENIGLKEIPAEKDNSAINLSFFDSHCATHYIQGGFEFKNGKIWGISQCMQENVYEKIERYKNSKRILLVGETGVGKELVARALHDRSKREGKFIAINCGTLGGDTNLQLVNLFGCRSGFAQDIAERTGYFLEANGGTLFLDEINSLSEKTQKIILRAIENEEIVICGEKIPEKVDLQIICSTNESLIKLSKQKLFREDLYYRISGYKIEIPPLRIRGVDDFKLIIADILKKENEEKKKEHPNWKDITISDEVMEEMATKPNWRGNVRQLRQTIQRAFADSLGKAKIERNIIFKIIEEDKIDEEYSNVLFPLPSPFKSIKELTKEVYRQAEDWLRKNPEKTQKDIAKMLGVVEDTVSSKFKEIKQARNSGARK